MKKGSVIRIKAVIEKDSPLDLALDKYLMDREAQRKKIKQAYEEKIQKQIKKIEQRRL